MTTGPRQVHDEIVALYPKLSAMQIYFRDAEATTYQPHHSRPGAHEIGVDRDQIICALANKAANTKAAILVLCDHGLADDAWALRRVLMENAVYLSWILHKNWRMRLDTYALSLAPSLKRFADFISEHYGNSPLKALVDDAFEDQPLQAISADVFKNDYRKWALFPNPKKPGKLMAVGLGHMLAELDAGHTKAKTGNVAKVVYFDCGQFVHSLAFSLLKLLNEIANEQTYALRLRPRTELSDAALAISNVWMLQVLGALNDFLSAGLEGDIRRLNELIKAGVVG